MSTLLCMLLDRSGSMATIKSDIDGGFDSFIARQREVEGRCLVTLNQFDTFYECVYSLRDVADVPPLDLEPRGGTALHDAIGRTIADLQHDIDAMKKKERPEKVIVVVLTDGMENSSVEWSPAAVKALVEAKQPAWDFVFIGADQDAIVEGHKVGVNASRSLRIRGTARSSREMFAVLGDATLRSRVLGEELSFTPEERAKAMDDDEPAT